MMANSMWLGRTRQRLQRSTLVRVMRLLGKRFWPFTLALLIDTAIVAVCHNVAVPFLMRDAIDAAIDAERGLLVRALILAAAISLGSIPPIAVMDRIRFVCVERTLSDLRVRLFHHVTALPQGEFDAGHSGDLISRATNDLGQIEGIYYGQFWVLAMMPISGIVATASIFVLDWRLGWVALLLGLARLGTNASFAKPIRKASALVQSRAGTHTERLLDLLQSIPVVRMFRLEGTVHGAYGDANAALTQAILAKEDLDTVLDTVHVLLYWVGTLGPLGLGLYFYAQGELSLGSVSAVVALGQLAGYMFGWIGQFVTGIQQSLAGADRVFELLDREIEPDCYAPGAIATVPSTASKLTFHQVSFCYPESPVDDDVERDGAESRSITALQEVTLNVPTGQTVALVGPSGSGKSTLIKLLLGFYPEQAGEILIDGRPARAIPLQQLRAMMAYVPQDAYLFDGTIEENIRMGRPGASFEEVRAAAMAANAHTFIQEHPAGYQTRTGEHGARLSGGQRQRIAIARALLKDAPILLLDEATSALDSESEQLVQDALSTLMRGRTTLAVAHRLSTIQHANTIYVMDQGRIVERGSHHELLSQNGLYACLHNLQFDKTAVYL